MGSVKTLHSGITLENGTNQDCIAGFESLLEMAKSGEIVSFACAGLTEDGSLISSWASHQNTGHFEMIGAIEAVKLEYADAAME